MHNRNFAGCLITPVNSGVSFQGVFLKQQLAASAAAGAILPQRPQARGSEPGLPSRPVYAQNGLVITPVNELPDTVGCPHQRVLQAGRQQPAPKSLCQIDCPFERIGAFTRFAPPFARVQMKWLRVNAESPERR